MAFAKRHAAAWIPVVVAFVLGVYFNNGVNAHTGDSALLHSGHSDTIEGTLTGERFRYSPRQRARQTVGAAEFVPIVETCAYARGGIFGGENPGVLQDKSGCAYAAPLDLPPGARIKKVEWFYDTSHAGSDVTLDVWKINPSGGQVIMAFLEADVDCNAPCREVADTITDPVIRADSDYALRFRAVNQEADGGRILKVVVTYTVASPGTM